MARMLFPNIHVADKERSKKFFQDLGFTFNENFEDDSACCMVINDLASIMMLTNERFEQFLDSEKASTASSGREVLLSLTCESREEVDQLVDRAIELGGRQYAKPQDHGFMYGRDFADLDGHVWEIVWFDPQAMPSA